MTPFFIDLWHDLREKRLWPIAVGLLAATLAVPIVLFKPAGSTPAPTVPIVSSGAKSAITLPTVSVSGTPSAGGSRLDTFTQHNPFKPMKDLAANTGGGAAATTVAGLKSVPSLTAAATTGGSGSGSHSSGGTPTAPSAGTGSTGGSPASSTPQVSQHTTTTSWSYVPTFKFGTPDKMKTEHNVTPFTLLPDATAPVLVFASADAKHAVFYIQDTSFSPQGEGKCDQPADKCRFVTLDTSDSGNEEAFLSADGTQEYDIQLLSIKRKTLSPSGAAKGAAKGKGKAVTGAGHRAAAIGDQLLPVVLGFSSSTTTTKRTK